MCGIIGCFNYKNHLEFVKKSIKKLKHRGIDGTKIVSKKDYTIAHLLHSIVGNVTQPIKYKNLILVANCEIYNYKELSIKYKLRVKNDADLIIKLIHKIGLIKAINEFDGVYACALIKENKIFLFRDIIGVKPIWYNTKPFMFASEKKALNKNAVELNPRQILTYNLKNNRISFTNKKFFNLNKKINGNGILRVRDLLINSVKKRIPKNVKVGLLFSGGVDSTTIAVILKKLGVNFTCYTSGVKNSQDIRWAKKAAKLHKLKLKIAYFDENKVKKELSKICEIIESNNVVKVGVSIPFYFASKKAQKDKIKVIFSGLGSEEIFAGYERFEKTNKINEECLHGLKQLYERDLYRDDVITMFHNIELRLPFLDHDLIKLALKIPGKFKMNNDFKKLVLRDVSELIGVDEKIAWRKKKAAQYGSRSDKILEKLAKPLKKSEYLKTVYQEPNLKLGTLYSSGKDSNLALYIMKKQNYEISCLISMLTNVSDSYMFHQPKKELIELQSKALGIPVVFGTTKGIKEKELKDLKSLIKKAKNKYNLDGVITGALFSNYQRERIKKVCEDLGLKTFSPLWHKNQELEIKELLKLGFEFILTTVAAYGFDKSWLGKTITQKHLTKLVKLRDKYGINIAGEGGEYESFVLNAPMFKKKIKIIDSEIIEENENTARLIIKKAKLS